MDKRRKRKKDRTKLPQKTFKLAEMIGENIESQLRQVVQ